MKTTNPILPALPGYPSPDKTPKAGSNGAAAALPLIPQAPAPPTPSPACLAKAATPPPPGWGYEGTDAFLLTWGPEGTKVGHSAVATQLRDPKGNATGTVAIDHLWPRGTVGKSCKDRADYRHQTLPEEQLRTFSGGEGRGADGIIRIHGDSKQNATIANALLALKVNQGYHAQKNNCASYTRTAVESVGLTGGTGARVTLRVGPLAVKKLKDIATPVSVHNALQACFDRRVRIEKQLPKEKQSNHIEGKWRPRRLEWRPGK